MHYVYLLRGKRNKIYVGYTSDLKKRIEQHKLGMTFTTKKMLPVDLIYYEAYKNKQDAMKRERSLKKYGNALTHLKKRVIDSLGKESAG